MIFKKCHILPQKHLSQRSHDGLATRDVVLQAKDVLKVNPSNWWNWLNIRVLSRVGTVVKTNYLVGFLVSGGLLFFSRTHCDFTMCSCAISMYGGISSRSGLGLDEICWFGLNSWLQLVLQLIATNCNESWQRITIDCDLCTSCD